MAELAAKGGAVARRGASRVATSSSGSGMADAEAWPRRLSELRVAELKLQLERRGLESKGVKAVLLERLQQAIADDGHDPEEYVFDCAPSTDKKPMPRRSNVSEGVAEDFEELMEDVNMENLVVKDEITDEDSNIGSNDNLTQTETKAEEIPAVSNATVKKEAIAESVSAENGTKSTAPRKREASEERDIPKSKKICKDTTKDSNGLEGEDSINLDIGEDEFLNEDGEAGTNPRKDVKTEAQGAADSSKQKSAEEKLPVAEKEDVPVEPTVQDVKEEKSSEANPAEANSNVSISEQDKSEKDGKKGSPQSASASSRNLWVSGLSSSTRAKDLKQLCSAHGKVIGAKIVINARTPGSRCYGYITMASAEDAQNCIKHLHRTELHGRMISMEKAKSESITGTSYSSGGPLSTSQKTATNTQQSPRRPTNNKDKPSQSSSAEKKKESLTKVSTKSKDGKSIEPKKENADKVRTKEENENASNSATENDKGSKSKKDRIRPDRPTRNPSSRDFLSFSKIKKEREAQRARELVRRARSEERRRHAAERSLRDLENRHRDENHRQRVEKERLALEREKIRIEREKIDREKHELQRLERERQKLERERLDLERLELKRAQMRLEEERERTVAKRAAYIYNSSGSGSGSGMLPRSKDPLPPPPPPVYDRPSGRGDNSGSSSTSRYNIPLSSHLNAPPPTYEMSAGSSSSGKPVDRGPSSRDRQRDRERPRDFKRDYPPPAPRSSHTSVSGSGMKYSGNGPSYESRQPLPPGTRPREQRYAMDNSDIRGSGADARGSRSGGGSSHDRGGGGSSSYRPNESSRRSPKPTSRDHRYSDSSAPIKGDSWSNSGMGSENSGRYGNTLSGNASYNDSRYGSSSYQPTPTGSNSYPNVVCYPTPRDFRPKY